MAIELKGGFTTEDRRLDRLPFFDERSRAYPVIRLIDRRKPRTRKWRCPVVLDQGREGACCGMAAAHQLAASPVSVRGVTDEYAKELYYDAQDIDPWPGGARPGSDPHYDGSAVIAAIRVLQKRGAIGAYHWAFSEPELALGVSYIAPAVLGVNWRDSMYDPDSSGWLDFSGAVVGGHAILCNGYNAEEEYYTLHNSWSKSWGRNGEAKVSKANMANWLADSGEACMVTQQKYITV